MKEDLSLTSYAADARNSTLVLICKLFIFSTSQVVELDFMYPSEGIHRRWDVGYRITSVAATLDQAAIVLSIPRRQPLDVTQETLRTSCFPSTHVKVRTSLCHVMLFPNGSHPVSCYIHVCILQEKWAKNLYISCVCYGRTVS